MLRFVRCLIVVATIGTAGFTDSAGAQRPAPAAVSVTYASGSSHPSRYGYAALEGALIGGAVGTVLGFVVGSYINGMCDGASCKGSPRRETLQGFLIGAGVGALLGLGRAAATAPR